LSLTKRDIETMCKIGELKSIEVRGRTLVHREELIRFARPAAPDLRER
jgi:hypothetical protein